MGTKITPSEYLIMEVLWSANSLTAREVLEGVGTARHWNANTVKTLLSRLVYKNIVAYEEDGARYRYRALVMRDAYVAAESRQFIDRLFGGLLTPLVAHLVDHNALTEPERKDLADLLRRLEE